MEHIPPEFEQVALDLLDSANTKGIILSWAKRNQKGNGHVNTRPKKYVIHEFIRRGYVYDEHSSRDLNTHAKLPWFHKPGSCHVFLRTKSDHAENRNRRLSETTRHG